MKRKNVKFVAYVGIFSAIGLVFDLLAGLIPDFWSAGGSISLAMLPIILMAYYYGVKGGLLTGLVIGSIQLFWGKPFGLPGALLDYVIPYTIIGLCGLFINKTYNQPKKKKILLFGISILAVGLMRVAIHTISGVLLYKATLWASFVYNAPYVLVSIGLCLVLSLILVDRLDKLFIWKSETESSDEVNFIDDEVENDTNEKIGE